MTTGIYCLIRSAALVSLSNTPALREHLEISYSLESWSNTAKFPEVSFSTASLESALPTILIKVSDSCFPYMEYRIANLTYDFKLFVAYQKKTSEMQYFE